MLSSPEQVMGQPDGARWSQIPRDLPVPAAHFTSLGWLNPLLAILLLVPGLPLIGILALITRISSRGPGIYRQTRVGYQGDTFTLYKIRTMAMDAEKETGPVWTSGQADPRITALGAWLRALHLDELPQLFNVLKRDMNLVGPRPERPEFTQFLAKEIPGYVGRLSVKPGITGLAQINLPPDSDLESVRQKLRLDIEYIAESTPMMDVRILLCTSLKMLGMRGYRVARALGLKRRPGDAVTPTPARRDAKQHAPSSAKPTPVSLAELVGQQNVSVGASATAEPESEGDAAPRRRVNGSERALSNGRHSLSSDKSKGRIRSA